MTNISKIATVMVRLVGLQFLFSGLIELTYLPDRIFVANHARSAALMGSAQLEHEC